MRNWLHRNLAKLLYKLFTFMAVKEGMIQFKNHYIFSDCYGRLWKIQLTGDYNSPIQIELIEQ